MLSIILATHGRPLQCADVIDNIIATTKDCEIIVVSTPNPVLAKAAELSEYDEKLHCVRFFFNDMNRMDAWNFGASKAKGDFIHGSADDLVYKDGWFEPVLEELTKDGRDDLYCRVPCQLDCYWAETGVGHRNFFIKHVGGCIVIPHYKAIYTDVEMSDRAIRDGVMVYTNKTSIEHKWNGPAPGSVQIHDELLYRKRKSLGFPDDFEAAIK